MNGVQTKNIDSLTDKFHSDAATPQGAARPKTFMCPAQVAGDTWLSPAEKREILASWASDARVVPGAPALRQLDNGAVVRLEDIVRELKSLDEGQQVGPTPNASRPFADWRSRLPLRLKSVLRRRWPGNDDDDDPPPCPAVVSGPFGRPLSGGETADPDFVLAA